MVIFMFLIVLYGFCVVIKYFVLVFIAVFVCGDSYCLIKVSCCYSLRLVLYLALSCGDRGSVGFWCVWCVVCDC